MFQDDDFSEDFWSQNGHVDPSVMVMKNRKELCEDLKYVISMPEMCDVTFLVGPDRQPVHGIRAILATRSRIMYQMILSKQNELSTTRKKRKSLIRRKVDSFRTMIGSSRGQLRHNDVIERLCIEIEDYDSGVFEKLMRYIHCGVVAVDVQTVVGLMIAARQFEFPELQDACWEFALQSVRPDTLSTLVDTATRYGQYKETRQLMQHVLDFLGDTPDVLHCCPGLRNLIPLRPDEHMC